MLNIAPSDSLADKLTSISDLNDLLVLDNKVCEPSASSYLSIYQLVKTITFVLYLFDMVEMNKKDGDAFINFYQFFFQVQIVHFSVTYSFLTCFIY